MDSQGDDEAAKIELTYSIPSHINRARPTLGTLVVCIIQVEHLRVQECDLVIGIFGTRYGIVDNGPYSRTASEIKRAIQSARATGKPQVLVYFSREALPTATGQEEDERVRIRAFRAEVYDDPNVLGFDYEGSGPFQAGIIQDLLDHLDSLTNEESGRFGLKARLQCVPRLVRAEGYSELAGDIAVEISSRVQLQRSDVLRMDIVLTLSTNLTNRIAPGGEVDVFLSSEDGGRVTRGTIGKKINIVSFMGVQIPTGGTRLRERLTIAGLRTDAVVSAGPIAALVEIAAWVNEKLQPAVLREHIVVSLRGSTIHFCATPENVDVVPIATVVQEYLRIRSFVLHYHGPAAEVFRTRSQEQVRGATADSGTMFALALPNLPIGCSAYVTSTNLGPTATQVEPVVHAVKVSTGANGSRASQAETPPVFLWAQRTLMVPVSNNLACWEVIAPFDEIDGATVRFGLSIVVRQEIEPGRMISVAGGLAPFYSSAAAIRPSQSLAVPRFLPRSETCELSVE